MLQGGTETQKQRHQKRLGCPNTMLLRGQDVTAKGQRQRTNVETVTEHSGLARARGQRLEVRGTLVLSALSG